jgi:hypothetical protein
VLVQPEDTSTGAEPIYYSKDPTGTVTLTARGSLWSGTFDITVHNVDGAPITTRGTFSHLTG